MKYTPTAFDDSERILTTAGDDVSASVNISGVVSIGGLPPTNYRRVMNFIILFIQIKTLVGFACMILTTDGWSIYKYICCSAGRFQRRICLLQAKTFPTSSTSNIAFCVH